MKIPGSLSGKLKKLETMPFMGLIQGEESSMISHAPKSTSEKAQEIITAVKEHIGAKLAKNVVLDGDTLQRALDASLRWEGNIEHWMSSIRADLERAFGGLVMLGLKDATHAAQELLDVEYHGRLAHIRRSYARMKEQPQAYLYSSILEDVTAFRKFTKQHNLGIPEDIQAELIDMKQQLRLLSADVLREAIMLHMIGVEELFLTEKFYVEEAALIPEKKLDDTFSEIRTSLSLLLVEDPKEMLKGVYRAINIAKSAGVDVSEYEEMLPSLEERIVFFWKKNRPKVRAPDEK